MRIYPEGKKPYMADFEVSDELVPDPFSEEPEPHTAAHHNRMGQRISPKKKNAKIKRNQEHK